MTRLKHSKQNLMRRLASKIHRTDSVFKQYRPFYGTFYKSLRYKCHNTAFMGLPTLVQGNNAKIELTFPIQLLLSPPMPSWIWTYQQCQSSLDSASAYLKNANKPHMMKPLTQCHLRLLIWCSLYSKKLIWGFTFSLIIHRFRFSCRILMNMRAIGFKEFSLDSWLFLLSSDSFLLFWYSWLYLVFSKIDIFLKRNHSTCLI
jgi:hypothetical protein